MGRTRTARRKVVAAPGASDHCVIDPVGVPPQRLSSPFGACRVSDVPFLMVMVHAWLAIALAMVTLGDW